MKIIRLKLVITAWILFFSFCFINLIHAYDVTGYGVTIDRIKENSSVTYCFCSDLWGTDIQTVSITSPAPLTQAYSLVYSTIENQWYYDKSGTQSEIESEFPDGIYTFDVTYTDSSTAILTAQLGGTFPPFPVVTFFDSDRVTWEAWMNPVDPHAIDVFIESDGGSSTGDKLPYDATYYDIPAGFIQTGERYNVEIMFLSSSYPNSRKNSMVKTTFYYPSSIPTISEWGMIIFFILMVSSALVVMRRKQKQNPL